MNNIKLADKTSIGIMKIEVMLHRYQFRDYYDIYSILKDGVPFDDLIEGAGRYTRHRLKTRDMLSMLTKGENFSKDHVFADLQPRYNVDAKDIELFIVEEIRKMNRKNF